ncbi:MAG TPA: zf-HC2 domain-containing protein [Ktedonobacterales bacterium]|nr:zf-HC2 domain-containing protein [Ktedonobacterales bacterium]
MTCHHARQQLAAYRRDDWTAAEMRALADHLADCDSCRQTEAVYRRVGESLRLLPTIMPDASFRESVFAAIAKEQRRVGPAAMLASRAETQPSLPVVRAPIALVTPIRRRTAPTPVMRAAVAIAAVLALALFATQYLPNLGTSGFAANFFRGAAGLGAPSASAPGIYANPDHVPFSSSEFSANTVYRGWVGSSWVYVYAGAAHTNGSASQSSGAVRVYDKNQTLVGVFATPGATQWVRITSVHGDILTLVANTGATLTFNMTSNSFGS